MNPEPTPTPGPPAAPTSDAARPLPPPTPLTAPPPSPAPNLAVPRSQRKIIIAGVAAAIVLIAAAITYFVFLPAHFASAYDTATKDPYVKLTAAMSKSFESFGRPAFSVLGTTPANDKLDIAFAQASNTAAQTALTQLEQADAHLTVLPGTAWRPAVRSAQNQAKRYQEYAAKCRTFLKDYGALTTYADKLRALQQQFADLDQELNTSSAGALAAGLSALADRLDGLAHGLRAISPPDYLQDYHNTILAQGDQFVSILRGMVTSLNAHDAKTLLKLDDQLSKLVTALDNTDQTFIDQLQNHSQLRSEIDQIKGFKATTST